MMTSPWNIHIHRVRTSWLLAGAGNEGARVISTVIHHEMKRFLGWMVAVASYGVEVFRASGLFPTVGKMVTLMLFILYCRFKNMNQKLEPGR